MGNKKIDLPACPACQDRPRVGRTKKGAGGWIIFCDSDDHYIEVMGKMKRDAARLWKMIAPEPKAEHFIISDEDLAFLGAAASDVGAALDAEDRAAGEVSP